jgi:hypothetical protein
MRVNEHLTSQCGLPLKMWTSVCGTCGTELAARPQGPDSSTGNGLGDTYLYLLTPELGYVAHDDDDGSPPWNSELSITCSPGEVKWALSRNNASVRISTTVH